MSQVNFHKLSAKLKSVFEQNKSKVLLEDFDTFLSGNDVLNITQSIGRDIRLCTSRGDAVGVSLPHSLEQVLVIISVIVNERVPVIFKRKDTTDFMIKRPLSLMVTGDHGEVKNAFSTLDLPCLEVSTMQGKNLPQILKQGELRIQTNQLIPDDVALILYTSGSTGEPRGVMIPDSCPLFLAQELKKEIQIGPHTKSIVTLPLSHTMCLNTLFLPTLINEGKCIITPSVFNINKIYRNIRQSGGNTLALISDLLPYMLQELKARGLDQITHVTSVTLSGGMISDSDIEVAKELFPCAEIYQGYGLTEATRIAIRSSREKNQEGYRPLLGVDIKIKNKKNETCEDNQWGEIYIKAPTTMKGYYNESFLSLDEQGYFKSGDLGKLCAGRLYISGRLDGILKVNGEKVSSSFVEQMALKFKDSEKRYKNAKCITVDKDKKKKTYLFLECHESEKIDQLMTKKNEKKA